MENHVLTLVIVNIFVFIPEADFMVIYVPGVGQESIRIVAHQQ
jgi:hypothetical protein